MKISLGWSGGKDASHALYQLLNEGMYEVSELHTVIDAATGEVPQHGIPESLIQAQSDALGIPITFLYTPGESNAAAYNLVLSHYYSQCVQRGIGAVAHGDIYLDELKEYREKRLQPFGLIALFPLWKQESSVLLSNFLDAGFKAVICSGDAAYFDCEDLGITLTQQSLPNWPAGVDPCGERGEFHTFTYDGPVFRHAVGWERGVCRKKDYVYGVTDTEGKVRTVTASYWSLSLSPRIAS